MTMRCSRLASAPAAALVSCLVVLAAFAVPAAAQTVSGHVSGEGRPIAGAVVRLLELDRTDITGQDGSYQFRAVPAGTYRLAATAPGFAPGTDTVRVAEGGADVGIELELRASSVALPPLVVSASPTARFSTELYQPVASKDRALLAAAAGTSFAEKLSDLPGVAVRGNGSTPSRPILRGLGDNEVLVLENGLRTGDIATYDPAHATPIDAMGIEEVDVVRGPATVLYGPSTIGGLVNVVTNLVPQAADHPVSGVASLEASTGNDGVSGYNSTVFSSGGTALRVSAGGVHTGDTRIPAGRYVDAGSGDTFNLNRQPRTFAHTFQGGAGLSRQGAFGMVGIGANHYESDDGIPGVPPNPNWRTAPPTTSRITQQRNTVELRSLLEAGGSLVRRIRLDASYNDYSHSEFPTAQDSSGVSDPQANHFHKRELNAVLQLEQRPLGRLSGAVGLWTNLEDLVISGDQPLGPNSTTTGLAAFAYEEFQAGPTTRIQGGVRYDYNRIHTSPDPQSPDSAFRTLDASRLTNAATASLGVIQQLGDRLIGSFSVARSFRAPTVQELFANGLDAASGTYTIGAASLGNETGIGVDASLKGDLGVVGFELTPFLNVIDQYLYGFLRGDTIQNFPVRRFGATRARLAGFEASASVAPAPHVVLLGNASYVNAQDTRAGVPLPFIPPLHGVLRASWLSRTYTALAQVRWAARQDGLGEGDTPTAGYAVVDLGAGVRLAHLGRDASLSLHCDNLFDQVYRDHTSVIKDLVPQPGRAFRIDYQWRY